jgi:hypothetical protein
LFGVCEESELDGAFESAGSEHALDDEVATGVCVGFGDKAFTLITAWIRGGDDE